MKKKKKKKKPWKQKRKKVFFRINTSKRAYDENKIITLTRVTLFFFLKNKNDRNERCQRRRKRRMIRNDMGKSAEKMIIKGREDDEDDNIEKKSG